MKKTVYLIPVTIFVLGLGLLIFGTSSTGDMTLLGLTFHPRIGKGLGIIAMIFAAITLLALYGNAQPPTGVERRQSTHSAGGAHEHGEDRPGDSHLSRRA